MRNYKRLVLLLTALIVVILCIFASSVMDIGQKLTAIHPAVAYLFYAVVILLVIFGIVRPALQIITAPIFSLRELSTTTGAAKQRWCRKIVANICASETISEEEKQYFRDTLKHGDETDDLIVEAFNKHIVPQIDEEIADTAKKVFLVTAVSQTSLYDMLGSLSANLNLVRRIVEICGFRPNNAQLVKLYIRTMTVALVAAGLEEIDMAELFSMVAGNSLYKIPGMLVGSVTQGVANAFMAMRVGAATKYYLCDPNKEITNKSLRMRAYRESLSLLKPTLASTIKSVVNIFHKKDDPEDTVEV